MMAFLAALPVVAVCMVVTGVIYETFTLTATEAQTLDTARVGHDNPVDGRLGWAPDVE